jgi:hypothetical protein
VSEDGFDRLRRRSADVPVDRPRDPPGRRSLFSVSEQPAAVGAVTVSCSSCGLTSVATPRQALRLAVPSLHLPLVKRGHPSWMRCPACGARTWVRLGLRL